jgi:antitoxin component YwqK of YwqJK toxin-antitoxin module
VKKLFLILVVLSFVFVASCYAQQKVDAIDSHGTGTVDFWIYWNADGSLDKTVALREGKKMETKYGPVENAVVDGVTLKKQKAEPNDFEKSIQQERYSYTKPFGLVYGENYIKGRIFGKSYFKNNVISRSEVDTNQDGKIDYREYYENGKLINSKSDKPSLVVK